MTRALTSQVMPSRFLKSQRQNLPEVPTDCSVAPRNSYVLLPLRIVRVTVRRHKSFCAEAVGPLGQMSRTAPVFPQELGHQSPGSAALANSHDLWMKE